MTLFMEYVCDIWFATSMNVLRRDCATDEEGVGDAEDAQQQQQQQEDGDVYYQVLDLLYKVSVCVG